MQCSERGDLLSLYALDLLEGAEKEELRQHLQTGCPTCIGRLAEIHAILAILPAAHPIAAPASARARLLVAVQKAPASTSAIFAQRQMVLPSESQATPRPTLRIGSALVGAAIAATVAALLLFGVVTNYHKSFDKYKELTLRQQQDISGLQAELKEARRAHGSADGSAAQFAMLKGTDDQTRAGGMLLWNPTDKTYYFCAENLRNLPERRTYELWLINADKKKFAGGAFHVDSHGSAKFKSTLSQANPGVIVATAVTVEPEGGTSEPTGAIQMVGDVN